MYLATGLYANLSWTILLRCAPGLWWKYSSKYSHAIGKLVETQKTAEVGIAWFIGPS